MSVEQAEIEIIHGDEETYLVTVTDDDGNPVDLTAGDLTVTARAWVGADALFTKSVGDGLELEAEPGTATLTLDADDLIDVDNAWTTLMFDVRFDSDDFGMRTPIRGQIRVIPSIGEPTGS